MAKRNHKSKKLSHYDAAGRASMVDVSDKQPTLREAEARAFVAMGRAVMRALRKIPKAIRWKSPAWPASWPPNARRN
jgi:hypothetical protein